MSSDDSDSDTISSYDLARIAFCKRSELLNELKNMKMLKDRNNKRKFFSEDFPEFDEILDTIEYESVSKVEEALLDMKWTTRRELEGCGMMIYEKASMRADLTLKYAQLVKKLQDVEVTEEGDTMKFMNAFDSHFMNFVKNVVSMNELQAKTSISLILKRKDVNKAVGFLLGNLYNVNFYTLAQIMQVAKLLKQKKGPRNKMLLEHMLSTMQVRMSHENVSKDMINSMIERYDSEKDGVEYTNPDSDAIAHFCTFLADIKENKFIFYDGYDTFEKISEESYEIEVGNLFQDAYTNEDCLNFYRDIALNIHSVRPDLLQTQFKDEINKVIVKLDAKKQKYDRDTAHKFNHLGNMIVEFYTAGLIDDDLVENFLNALKASKMPKKFFRCIFLEVLKRYEGSKMSDYFQYFRTICTEMPEFKSNITTVQEYIQNRGIKRPGGSKRLVLQFQFKVLKLHT